MRGAPERGSTRPWSEAQPSDLARRAEARPGAATTRVLVVAAALVALAPATAAAHDFAPGVLALTETDPGRFTLTWTEPVDGRGEPQPVDVVLPASCRRDGERVECGAAGLAGELAFTGLAPRTKVVVVVRWRAGRVDEALVTGAEPSVRLAGPAGPPPARAVRRWLALGVEHILSGFDHLAFLVGLLLVLDLALGRRLLAAVTAFTVAHSVTLALAVLGVLRLPGPVVEAAIAASVVLVAREALSDRPTALRRRPWLAAGAFGLVHGLGFAGTLAAVGLPRDAVARCLLWFNLGVELGQLAVVAAVILVAKLVFDRAGRSAWARRGMAYVTGSLGAAWFVARAIAIAGGG